MRNLKRALSLAVASVMLLGMMIVGTGAVSVNDFGDADQIASENLEAATITTGLGLFAGADGNFLPDQPVTRAQMATIICKLLYGNDVNADNFKGAGTFTDTAGYQTGWAEGYINMCASLGIVSGYNETTYGPGDTVTTWQASLMLQRALGYWVAGETINELTVTTKGTQLGLYGDLTLSANEPLAREDVAVLVFNTLFAQRVSYNEDRNVYVKDNDFSIAVNNGTDDETNTLAYTTYGLYSVDGTVTENSYTNKYLDERTKVVFDEAKDVTGDNLEETEYSFEVTTGLDMIGHAATVYYTIERKAPVVYAIVDDAVLAEQTTVGSNFSTTAANAGFSRDTSDTVIVANYDLDTEVNYKSYKSSDPVLLISNSSDLTVDYAIILDQELDYVERLTVDDADEDNVINTYRLEVNNSVVDDTNAVALNDVAEEDYVIVTMIPERGIDGADLYILETARTETDTITRVTRSYDETTRLSSEGVDFSKSPVDVDAALVTDDVKTSDGFSVNGTCNEDYAVTKYIDVLSRGEYVLIFDSYDKLIAVAPVEVDHTVNAAYVAQFGYKINTAPSLNDQWALTAHIYFADGTNGIYTVDVEDEDCYFYGSMADNGVWTTDNDNSYITTDGTKINVAATSGNFNYIYGGAGNGVYGPYIGLYDVTVNDDNTVVLEGLGDNVKADIDQVKKGVTYMGADSGDSNGNYYGDSQTTFFFVSGSYGNKGDDLMVGVVTGMANVPTVTLATGAVSDPDEEGSVTQAFFTQKTGYKSVDVALITGYELSSGVEGIYFYDGEYTTIRTSDGSWDLEITVYDAVTGEEETLSYTDYSSDSAARKVVKDVDIGFYTDSGDKDAPLDTYANDATDTAGLTDKGDIVYAHSSVFERFNEYGDILTMYTAANKDANGVTATDALVIDLTGNRINSLEDLSDLIDDRTEVYKASAAGQAAYDDLSTQTAKVSYSYDEDDNSAAVIFVTSVIKEYNKDYTGQGGNADVEAEMTSLAVSNDGGNIKVVMGAAIGEAGTAHATYTLVSTNMITGEQTTRVFTEDISVPGSGSTVTGSISNRNMSDMYTYELTAELNFTASDGTDYLWTGTWANG